MPDVTEEPPRPVHAMANYVADILEAGSVKRPGATFVSPIRCIRRPGRKPCAGRISITPQAEAIEWQCTACHSSGTVADWRGTVYDLSEFVDVDNGALLLFHLSSEEHSAIKEVITSSPQEDALLAGAVWKGDSVALHGSEDVFELLAGSVAASANHTTSKRKQRLLDSLFERMNELVARAE